MKSQKGFISSIGDDFPSLIPIFLGLLIFFSVFLSTYNTYKTNTTAFSLQQQAISVATIMKTEPVISDYNSFTDICDKVNTNKKWVAFLTDLDMNVSKQKFLPLDKQELYNNYIIKNDDSTKYNCPNDNWDDLKLKNNTKKIIYMFPIDLDRNNFSVPVKLFVIVWE